jgi:hypothetical protein
LHTIAELTSYNLVTLQSAYGCYAFGSVEMRCALLSVVPEGGQAPELIRELARETKGVPQHLRISASLSLPKTLSIDSQSPTNQNMIVEWLQSASC